MSYAAISWIAVGIAVGYVIGLFFIVPETAVYLVMASKFISCIHKLRLTYILRSFKVLNTTNIRVVVNILEYGPKT